MKIALYALVLTLCPFLFGQNQNLSNGIIFDGEPYLSINPANPQHMVVAWLGFLPGTNSMMKTKVSFDGGSTWSTMTSIPHQNPQYGSADPCMEFDNDGNVYLSYIDFSASADDGEVYVVKSSDGGLNWETPMEVIDAHADAGKYPIDRPWMSIDQSNGSNEGRIYITTMSPKAFGPIAPPHHPYFISSNTSGTAFEPWRYLDTVDYLAGDAIPQPMPTQCVSANGTLHTVYPSYVPSQSPFARYILASSPEGGISFDYKVVLLSTGINGDPLAKKGNLLRSNPANADHLAFFYLDSQHGDLDVFVIESLDAGDSWSGETRINDDPIANNRMQDLIWADFDEDGDLVVSWRDRRNAPDSTYTTDSEIFGAVRSNGNTSFSTNFSITENAVAYDTILASSGNDFMCIKLVEDTMSAVWGDTRNGRLNIWFQRMTLDGEVLSTQRISDESIPKVQVYPNPANDKLLVEGENLREIKLHDLNGQLLMHEVIKSNSSQVELNIQAIPNGVFAIQIITEDGNYSEQIVKQ